jgi:hypothetical protein
MDIVFLSQVRINLSAREELEEELYENLSEEHFRRYIEEAAKNYMKTFGLEHMIVTTETS